MRPLLSRATEPDIWRAVCSAPSESKRTSCLTLLAVNGLPGCGSMLRHALHRVETCAYPVGEVHNEATIEAIKLHLAATLAISLPPQPTLNLRCLNVVVGWAEPD